RIKGIMITHNPIIHPTVMFKNDDKAKYNELLDVSQDYLKWLELYKSSKFKTLDEPLLFYRISSDSVTKLNKKDKVQRHINLINRFNEINNIVLTKKEVSNYLNAIHNPYSVIVSLDKLKDTFNIYM